MFTSNSELKLVIHGREKNTVATTQGTYADELFSIMLLFLVPLLTIAHLVSAVCECGYAIGNNEGDGFSLFMDRLETDFSQLHYLSQSHDWVAQQFTVSAKDGRGNYSKAFTPANVYIPGGESQDQSEHEDGLQLRVSSDIGKDKKVPASEVDTARLDLHWGSFRAGMKLTETKGTCAAFFWVGE
jgi:hypothetical protein